ncbi:MAG: DUF63 family protein [Candidatus Nanohaloarchaeota archaeon]|nr:DUF63 family protein [Candidatus Nanohaloarchaeota archaeon]
MVLDWIIALYGKGYYTFFTTFINVVLGMVIFYWFLHLVEKGKLSLMERRFWIGSVGWVIAGVIVRLYADAYAIAMPYKLFLITPFIYLEVLVISYLVYKFFYKVWEYTGYVLSFLFLIGLIPAFEHFYWQYGITAIVMTAVFYGLSFKIIQDSYASFAYAMQMLDASTTFLSITFRGFYEEHMLARELIAFAEHHNVVLFGSGAWSFLVMKALLVGAILYAVKKYYSSTSLYSILIYFTALLGLAVGLRNLINLVFL